MLKVKISLLIPTLGQRAMELKRLLNSLAGQDYKNIEAIVISQDNHQVVEKLCNAYKTTILINHIKIDTKGLSLARNVGFNYATGEIIVLSDDDCWYPNDAMSYIAKEFKTYSKIDVLLTQIYDLNLGCPYKKYKNAPMNLLKVTSLLSRSSIELAYRKNEHTLLFDERFGLGARYVAGEENDFLIRCLKSNKNIVYQPRVTVYHEKKINQESSAQLIAKGAFYAKNFGYIICIGVLILDLVNKHQNNFRWFWHGYYDFKKNNKQNKRNN